MKIKLSVANYKVEVLSNEGKQILFASADNYNFEGDVAGLVEEFGKIQATFDDPEDFTKQ